jgi:hypothetical protein
MVWLGPVLAKIDGWLQQIENAGESGPPSSQAAKVS